MAARLPPVPPAAAKIVEQRTYYMPGRLQVTEHFFEVPLDYSRPAGPTIRLFARDVQKIERSIEPLGPRQHRQKKTNIEQSHVPRHITSSYSPPWILFLQGGPGFGCGSPQFVAWSNYLIEHGYQVLHLDQRGTGLSTPISSSVVTRLGDVDAQLDYLRCFRADSIIHDCEAIRQVLVPAGSPDRQKWSVLGQSFGGFCSLTYLSFFPQSLREVFLVGGLAPIGVHPDQVYEQLYRRVIERNVVYYNKYPEDVERVKRVVRELKKLDGDKIRGTEASGGALTPRRFQQLGLLLGGVGGVDTLHDIVLRCTSDLDNFGEITWPSLRKIDQALPFNDAVLYAILHEQLYCEGFASRWSAERVRKKFPCFSTDEENDRIFFTGEMVYPWMVEDYTELRPLAEVTKKLAEYEDWPRLYDEAQLRKNQVPVYAAVLVDDMYVDYKLSRATAETIIGADGLDPVLDPNYPGGTTTASSAGRPGRSIVPEDPPLNSTETGDQPAERARPTAVLPTHPTGQQDYIAGCKMFITNTMYHDAIRAKPEQVLTNLFILKEDAKD